MNKGKSKAELWGNLFGHIVGQFLGAWLVMLAIGATTSLVWSYWTCLLWVVVVTYVIGVAVRGA